MIDPEATAAEQISFGPFRLLLAQRRLLNGDTPVRLGGRAIDILIALVERPGETIGKEELIARVWPKSFVEEGNLKVHVAGLRKAIGDGRGGNRFIANVPGRGYCFVAPVSRSRGVAAFAPAPTLLPVDRGRNLPPPLARMVGRVEIVDALVAQLPKHRFITIVGPGGIGKTTVALAVADGLVGGFRDGVHFVDLAPIADPSLVPSALASALGVAVRSGNPMNALLSALDGKHALILLDSCEHLIEAVADMADALFRGARDAHILATSREPLRVDGERVHRLAPLRSPPRQDRLMAAEALAFPAVQLFAERATASVDGFELSDSEAPIVADICRRLDGIALAIEIAAGRADAFGVRGIAEQLDDRFRLMMRGRRTALTRHQTLEATLDWSYALLTDSERLIFRRLALFAGYFSMDSAVAVLGSSEIAAADIVDGVANLIAKSLVSAALEGRIAVYRLLDTTRAYAATKLSASGERDRFAARHAAHFRDLLGAANVEWRLRPELEWREKHRHLVDNVRAALDWSFSSAGDAAVGVTLTLGAVPLWFESSLTRECQERVERALSVPAAFRNDRLEMGLAAALAWSLMQTRGSVAETTSAWSKVLEISERLDDADHRLRAIWGLWSGLLNRSELKAALDLARQFAELAARAKPDDGPVGDRMIGYILHLMGDQAGARLHMERMLEQYVEPVTGSDIIRFVFDQRATARCFLCRILWLQGFADQGMRMADAIIDQAIAGGDTLTLCQALVQAGCPLALLVGDLDRNDRFVRLLLDHSTRNGLEFWKAWGRCFEGVLFIKRGEVEQGVAMLGVALAELRAIQYGVYYIVFVGEYSDALGRVGRVAEGLVAIAEALRRCERNSELWYLPELLRIEAELVCLGARGDTIAEAERRLLRAIDVARTQRTPAWELRTAMSLARLWRGQDRRAEALDLLRPILAAFTEGFSTGDMRAANELLEVLRGEIGEANRVE